ncbi:hypothetical protein POM88_035090 [Heracleum sosnowskyi]|uniref:SWIM-type domain-containing protein n=1 Tax=Heracleum sosnowskyi TaxID=360622 RepID=A0AAD8HME5_9APIA|nr:hypothetical protein POM88_035090 [Heracleum sosnowskyi]
MASSSSHGVLPHCGLNDSDLVECLSDSTGDRNNVILDTSCDSTANNEVEEFIEGFDDSFSNSAQLWIPNLPDTNLKPYPGQRFSELEDACTFYTNYATTVGFNVRRETQRVRGSIVMHKYVVCSKSGTHDTSMSIISDNSSELSHNDGNGHFVIDRFIEVHNHPMVTEFGKQFLRANRSMNVVHRKFVVDAATTNLGSYRAHALFKSLTGSYSEVGATAKDFQNWMRDVKLFIGKRDVDMLIEKFKTKKETSDGVFFYEYETDSNGHLTRIFWADVQGRQSYDVFGDVISFDATYRTNKYGMVFVPFIGVDNHWKSITFAACLLNHEDITNFTWACEMFLKVFQRPPWCLITDQCPAMKVAIAETFSDSVVHRYWNIVRVVFLGEECYRIAEKPSNYVKMFVAFVSELRLGLFFCAESEFMKKLNKFVWSSHISVAEFEEGWSSVLKEFELSEHIWLNDLYEMRKSWIPAFFRDKPMGGLLRTTSRSESSNFYFNHFVQKGDTLSEFYMCYESAIDKQLYEGKRLDDGDSCVPQSVTEKEIEKDAAQLYTRSMFYKVQTEIKASCYHIKLVGQPIVVDGINKFVVKDKSLNDTLFEVDLCLSTNDVSCSCHLFTRVGYLCRHCFFCLGLWGIEEIPRQFLSNRWMKNAVARFCTLKLGSTIQDSEGYKTRDTSKKVWNEFQGCLGDVCYNKDGLEFLLEELKFLRIRVKQKVNNPCATKDDILQEIYGVRPSTSIIVHPPLQSNNKGCCKRIIGPAERSCDGKDRPKRVCKHCNVKAFHDSRNCPMKGEQLQVNPLENGLNVNVQGSAPPTLNVENLVNVNVQGFVPPNLNVEKSV